MRGRKPTPTTLKLLAGNPGRRPLNDAEPQPDPLDAGCPVEFADPVAQAEWPRAIVPAIRIGHVTAADRTLAIAHCILWASWQSQLAEAIKDPHVVAVGRHKYPRPNPAQNDGERHAENPRAGGREAGIQPDLPQSRAGEGARHDSRRARQAAGAILHHLARIR